jgi:hypothetical protein
MAETTKKRYLSIIGSDQKRYELDSISNIISDENIGLKNPVETLDV